jgi:hypothetical protein
MAPSVPVTAGVGRPTSRRATHPSTPSRNNAPARPAPLPTGLSERIGPTQARLLKPDSQPRTALCRCDPPCVLLKRWGWIGDDIGGVGPLCFSGTVVLPRHRVAALGGRAFHHIMVLSRGAAGPVPRGRSGRQSHGALNWRQFSTSLSQLSGWRPGTTISSTSTRSTCPHFWHRLNSTWSGMLASLAFRLQPTVFTSKVGSQPFRGLNSIRRSHLHLRGNPVDT